MVYGRILTIFIVMITTDIQWNTSGFPVKYISFATP